MADLPEEPRPIDGDEDKAEKSSSSDDDSSSSSSGSSSSSSSSSDSESEDEAETAEQGDSTASAGSKPAAHGGLSRPGASAHGTSSSSGPALSMPRHDRVASAEPLNVNSTRAAARFRAAEQSTSQGLMPLGTRKRDRRTIEEIQRDLRNKRPKPPGSSASAISAARSSPPQPPRGSPVRSPEAEAAVANGVPLGGVPLGQFGANGRLPSKRKPVSAHDRLAMKLNGRRSSAAKPKKTSAASSAAPGSNAPSVSVMTASNSANSGSKPARGPMAISSLTTSTSDYGADEGYSSSSRASTAMPQVPPVDGKVVRALLRAMLRFGDLTDVGLYSSAANFADEYKQPSFVERANLASSTRLSSERLFKLAEEVAQRAKQAVEARPTPQDSIKFHDVEVRPSQVIERLYENLKLRVAVQRALRTAGCQSGSAQTNVNGAYVLVSRQSGLDVLGIHARDLPAWSWAEKEHDWSPRKDAALLLGMYVHGFGGWEDMLNDDLLHFQGQRALKGERLKKRAENLLKRVPPPDVDAGDPRVVQLANALSAPANSNLSLGDRFSAIIHNGGIAGVSASPASSFGVPVGSGRMQRAAERIAARQQQGEDSSASSSLMRRHGTPSQSQSHSNGASLANGSLDRHRKSSSASGRSHDDVRDEEPEDGEVGAAVAPAASPATSTTSSRRHNGSTSSSSRHKRRSPSVDADQSSGKKHRSSDSSRSASKKDKREKKYRRASQEEVDAGPSARGAERETPVETEPVRLLTEDESYDKWKPNKKLREIRQVLKKMKIMAEWSRNQKDETVVEKVFKYVSTIGEAIDAIVVKHDGGEVATNATSTAVSASRDADELCTCLWTYAAGFTPFSPQRFERLYDDICADGDALLNSGQ